MQTTSYFDFYIVVPTFQKIILLEQNQSAFNKFSVEYIRMVTSGMFSSELLPKSI